MFGNADAAIAAAMGAGLSADSVTLTEADMNDPDLAAELAAVLGESIPAPPQRRAAAPPPAEQGGDWDAALRQQIGAKKKLALQLKATDKKAAMHALREAKALEATLKARPPPATVAATRETVAAARETVAMATGRAAKAAAAAPAAELSLEAAMSVAVGSMGGANPDSVTVSDADMLDPELLAELAAISGNPDPAEPELRAPPRPPPPPSASLRDREAGAAAASQRRASAAVVPASTATPTAAASRLPKSPESDDELSSLMESIMESN